MAGSSTEARRSGLSNACASTRTRRRWPWIVLATMGCLTTSLWFAVRYMPWMGPSLADGLRVVFGSEPVTRLEELTAKTEDRMKRLTKRSTSPRSLDQSRAPASLPIHPNAAPQAGFRPADVAPMFATAAAGDGTWTALPNPDGQPDSAVIFTTMLHPDPERSWAELFLFAIDLNRTRLYAVPGTREPVASTAEGQRHERTGLIPESHHARLLAAFNGGFKAEHGYYGMRVEGVTLLSARPLSCTIAAAADGALHIGTWSKLRAREAEFVWWRQMPACMAEEDRLHAGTRR